MTQQYDDTNRGALFANDRKENENHPDLKGQLNVDGVEYWVSAWKKTSKAGQKFLSISVTPKEERMNQGGRRTGGRPIDESDIAF